MGERAQLVFDTNFVELTKQFNVVGKISNVKIPGYLYKEFLQLYQRSEDLHAKLRTVMNDGEHIYVMKEGRDFFKLPPDNYLQKDLRDLRIIMDSFNPYEAVHQKNGKVRLKGAQIQGFFNLFAKDYDIVHGLFETFRNTDYLKFHRHLRDEGVKYAGPTSLQEIVNVFVGLARAQNKQRAYLRELSGAEPRA